MKKIVWVILFLILLVGAFVLISIKFKGTDNKEYSNVSVATLFNDEKIKTGLIINGYTINTSETYELLVIEKGNLYVKNFNLENQDFYEIERNYNITENNTRLDINLEKPIYPKIDTDYLNGKIKINLIGGNLREVKTCLKGSTNYLFLTAEDKLKIRKLEGYENYDSCYDLETNLENEYTFNITYKELDLEKENEYINMTLIDFAGNSITETIK